jgi:hypothetical protein
MRSDPIGERRGTPRRAPADDEPVSRVRLRAGRELTVVDVSSGGALVEGPARLLPGTHVDVHIVTKEGRTLVRSRVVRAHVHYLDAAVVRYRGGIAFERSIDISAAGYAVPGVLVGQRSNGDHASPDSPAAASGYIEET